MTASLLFPLAFFIFMYKFLPLYAVTKLARFYPRSPDASPSTRPMA